MPRGSIVALAATELLAQRAGELTTTAPVSYAPEVSEPEPIAPPIRFGGNLTFLGYEPKVRREYAPGESVEVITYWRAEGELLPDLTLLTHLLASPVTPIGIRDVLYVNPVLMRDRDVFIQVTRAQLPAEALPGELLVSVGVYRQADLKRLPVLEGDQERGDRIFLYSVEVLAPEPAAEG